MVLNHTLRRWTALSLAAGVVLSLGACAADSNDPSAQQIVSDVADQQFTIAVIPDTQNYLDYTHQTAAGFAFDANEMFIAQMQHIANNLESAGGDIAFVTSLGDVWQHQTLLMDPEHEERGFKRASNPLMDAHFAPTDQVRTVEMPKAHEGFSLIAGKVPFSVVPGNHDYDAMWTDAQFPPAKQFNPKDLSSLGTLHPGGLNNFRSVFGAETEFFKDKPWYVSSHDGGADSAQIFSAGGYQFLHIGLQFDPPNDTLAWAAEVIKRYPGLPTIVSTHDYLNTDGQRQANPIIDGHKVDAIHNSAEMVWDKLIAKHDQIFLVLCGHQHGQATRMDDNDFGNPVWQLLSDYQGRHQTSKDAGVEMKDYPIEIGDGWMRFLTFDMSAEVPEIQVRTYSTHYQVDSADHAQYAEWYKYHEQPHMSDQQFNAADSFNVRLKDFHQRFGAGSVTAQARQ